MEKEDLIVCFSGGRTSGYMSWFLKKYLGHLYNLIFIYANTGLEHENTLEFVNKCDIYFGLNLIWLEAKVYHGERTSSGYTITNFEKASRRGEPFKEVIKKYGLPNKHFIHCTRELKNNPIKKWRLDNGHKKTRIALGIRADEPKRIKLRLDAMYPLQHIKQTTKQEILDWWKEMPFDLELEEKYGNCVTCYKKSDKKLDEIAQENPQYFDFFLEMEKEFSTLKPKEGEEKRIIFRHERTAEDILKRRKLPKNLVGDECAEECGSVIVD